MSSDDLTTIVQTAARGGLFLFIGSASSTVIMAIGGILVARLLGPSSYGLYSLSLVIPTFLVSVSDMGMNFALVRLTARLRAEGHHARANRLLRLGILLKLTTSALAFFICYAGSTQIATTLLNRPELAPFVRFASVLIVFQALFDATNNAFIGSDLMQYTASTQIMMSILKGTLCPALVLIGLGITGVISGYILSLAAAGLTGACILFARPAGIRVKATSPTDAMLLRSQSKGSRHGPSSGQTTDSALNGLRALLGYGFPLYVAAILTTFLLQYQNIVLAHFANNVEIGNFNATWNFTQLVAILSYPIMTSLFPMFSKMDPRNRRDELSRTFALTVKYVALVMVFISVALMVFSRDLIYLTYGKGYALAPRYLMLLSALYLLSGIGFLSLGSFLNGVADTRTFLKMSVLGLAIYLPLGPVLAWVLGPYGLLIAYIISNATGLVYGVRQASMKFGARPDLKASARILLAAFGASVPTMALVRLDGAGVGAINLIIGGILYLLLYLTLVPILRAVNKEDISNLRTALSKVRIVARLVDPVLNYETRLLSKMRPGRD